MDVIFTYCAGLDAQPVVRHNHNGGLGASSAVCLGGHECPLTGVCAACLRGSQGARVLETACGGGRWSIGNAQPRVCGQLISQTLQGPHGERKGQTARLTTHSDQPLSPVLRGDLRRASRAWRIPHALHALVQLSFAPALTLVARAGTFRPGATSGRTLSARQLSEFLALQEAQSGTWSPDLNAHCELFVHSIKDEALEQMLMLGGRSLHDMARQHLAHDHHERNHQGLDNQLIAIKPWRERRWGRIVHRGRLGWLLSYYYREVA
jgi:hypothetical protein